MDSAFVRGREKVDYQKRLAVLLVEVCHRLEVPRDVANDPLALMEDFSLVNFVSNRFYWSREFHSKVGVRGQQYLLAGWQSIELFSMRTFKRPSC